MSNIKKTSVKKIKKFLFINVFYSHLLISLRTVKTFRLGTDLDPQHGFATKIRMLHNLFNYSYLHDLLFTNGMFL